MHSREYITNFPLESDQCALLLDLESAGSVRSLAELRGRDVSAINRQLQKIADTAPVLEKQQGRWVLSSLGRELNDWTREALLRQQQVLKKRPSIRLASSKEFASVILAPCIDQLVDLKQKHHVSVVTTDDVETLILNGKADLAFESGRPNDPAIRFKSIKHEPFCVIASSDFVKRHKVSNFLDLIELPYLWYSKANAVQLLKLVQDLPWISASFDDISAARGACLSGHGWTILPAFSIKVEVEQKKLKKIAGPRLPPEKYGVWWHRDRKSLDGWIDRAARWLEEQDLG